MPPLYLNPYVDVAAFLLRLKFPMAFSVLIAFGAAPLLKLPALFFPTMTFHGN
jgi:hypothetical protein